jgi:hypothetical protein
MRMPNILAFIAAGLLVCIYWLPARAQGEVQVDLELVIAVDVSRSMTPHELEIQRRGYAEALVSEEVVNAMIGGFTGQVALTYVEWAGTQSQHVLVDWTLIKGKADATAFAARITSTFSGTLSRTSISAALDFAATRFDGNGFSGLRRVIDISGDGPNNQGRPVESARDDAIARGIVINGLPLMTREGMGYRWHLEDLDQYYYNCVIGGPGSFVVPVMEWSQFSDAVRRKLVLELAAPRPFPSRRSNIIRAEGEGYDCLIGEKIWGSIWDGQN